MPLLIRRLSPDDEHGRQKVIKPVELEDLTGHFYILTTIYIISFVVFIFERIIGSDVRYNQKYNSKTVQNSPQITNSQFYFNLIVYRFYSYKRTY